jgi:N-acetylglutamate synthase-like GNAT family acetyltransferase
MDARLSDTAERIDVVVKPEGFDDWAGLLALLRESFATMEGRIDPPSSLHAFDEEKLKVKAAAEDLLLAFMDGVLAGCLFAVPRGDVLYLSKIAVRPGLQGRGLAQRMMALAQAGARARGFAAFELQTRVELVENHRAFAELGFVKVGETRHPGFTRATSFTFRKALV